MEINLNHCKILYQLIEEKLNQIQSIELINVEADQTDNIYYPFIFIDNHLGISDKLIKTLFNCLLKEYWNHINWSTQDQKLFSTCLLVINPSWYPLWGIRKQLLKDKYLSFDKELILNELIINSKIGSKISQVWYYRLYLFQSNLNNQNHFKEYQLILNFLKQNNRNYYCWSYLIQLNWSFNQFKEIYQSCLDCLLKNPSESGGYKFINYYCLKFSDVDLSLTSKLLDMYHTILRVYSKNECAWSGYYDCIRGTINRNIMDLSEDVNRLNDMVISNNNHVGIYWRYKCCLSILNYTDLQSQIAQKIRDNLDLNDPTQFNTKLQNLLESKRID